MAYIYDAISWAVIITVLIGCIPYLAWIVYTAFKKRWRKLGLQILIPVITYGFLFLILFFLNSKLYDNDLLNMFNTKVELGTPVFEYHSERHFNGDGYSLSVYKLPESVKKRFFEADELFLNEFPKLPDYRSHWSQEHWREGPEDPGEDEEFHAPVDRGPEPGRPEQ